MIILDTDHFSVVTDARHQIHARLVARLNRSGDSLGLPVVSVEEQLRSLAGASPPRSRRAAADRSVRSPDSFD